MPASIAEEAEHPKLRLWCGFNTTLNRRKKKRRRRKKNPTVHARSSESTRVLVCKHLRGQVPWSQWKYAVTGNELQACLERKAETWWGARAETSTWASTGGWGSHGQEVTRPDMEALYLWGCWYKLRYMQLRKRINYIFVLFKLLRFTGVLHLNITGKFTQYYHLRELKIINQILLEKKVGSKRGGWM